MTNTIRCPDGDNPGGTDEAILTVQVIAASQVVRAGLAALIAADERFEVSGSFSTATEAQREIELAERPADVIIAELGESSSEEIAELATTREGEESDGPVVVALIANSQQRSVLGLLRSGVSAALPNTGHRRRDHWSG